MVAMIDVDWEPRTVSIFPDISNAERCTKTIEENTYTIFYEVMSRWVINGNAITIERAHVDTDTYRSWLDWEGMPDNGIPPHISFGGAVVSGEGDPTFYSRWEHRTISALADGRIK